MLSNEIIPSNSDKPPVVFLLAVWGKSYIENFFNFSLCSLLAPGNIPALSQEYPSTFIFLTHNADIPVFKAQPMYAQLETYCTIEFLEISDLIFNGSYSATLTLAYERGIRSRGDKMCQTYFFFLVSDYIMANGSLKNMKPYLEEGYSGITTGNFLVVEEYISQKLHSLNKSGIIDLNPREMLALAFPYMHPVSVAQTVTQSFTHAIHANRFFWKQSENVIVGRFYLRHMLCIKPEIDEFVIGSSCDYSFIPEMCPSGKVAHIQDSDEYCVIEIAPFEYEQSFINSGGFSIDRLADQLAEWTTSVHRANAQFPVIYHSEDLDEAPLAAIQTSADFVTAVAKRLPQNPQSIRGHVYWTSCLNSIVIEELQKPNKSRIPELLNLPSFSQLFSNTPEDRSLLQASSSLIYSPIVRKKKLRERLIKMLVGASPDTSLWHFHWFDDYKFKQLAKQILFQNTSCVVIAFEPIKEIVGWLEPHYPGCCTYQFNDLLMSRSRTDLQKIFRDKQHVLMCLTEKKFNEIGASIRQFAELLPPDTPITVYLKQKKAQATEEIKTRVAICLADLLNSQIICEQVCFHRSLPRATLQRAYSKYSKKLLEPRKRLLTRAYGLIGLGVLNTVCLIGNLLSLPGSISKKKSTSLLLNLRRK